VPPVNRLARFFLFIPSSSDSRACKQINLFTFRVRWMRAIPTLKSVGRSDDNQVVHGLNALCVNELWYISRLVRYWSDYTNCSADLPSAAAIITAVCALSMIRKFVSCSLRQDHNTYGNAAIIPRSAKSDRRGRRVAANAERFFPFKVLLSIRRSGLMKKS